MSRPDFQHFELEKLLSLYEYTVEYNYSESGVHPMMLGELLGDSGLQDALLETELNYPEVNGNTELRQLISERYDGAGPDNVLVTVGAAEANYVTAATLLEPGDEVVTMRPHYPQVWGLAKNAGITIKSFDLEESQGWAVNLDQLEESLTGRTKMIAVCNPNNPTGYILTDAEMDAIVDAADKVGAWILADEVYSGAERNRDEETRSFYGRYDRVLAINSMSKAYGLPGLRIGWVAGPEDMIDEIWRRHEYTTISSSMLGNKLAAIALSPEVRPQIIARTRELIQNGFDVLEETLARREGMFSIVPSQASAMTFVRYHLDINSSQLVERLRLEKSVLVVPGDMFGLDHHLRISFALPTDYLRPGLDRLNELMDEIAAENG